MKNSVNIMVTIFVFCRCCHELQDKNTSIEFCYVYVASTSMLGSIIIITACSYALIAKRAVESDEIDRLNV